MWETFGGGFPFQTPSGLVVGAFTVWHTPITQDSPVSSFTLVSWLNVLQQVCGFQLLSSLVFSLPQLKPQLLLEVSAQPQYSVHE